MRRTQIAVVVAFLSVGAGSRALAPVTQVIAQPDAPIRITSYSAAYQEGGRYATEGIHHNVAYDSATDRKIVAVQIGLVSFDIWNEFLDRTGGVSMDELAPHASSKGTWVARAYADFSFQTGVAYVAKVRFVDGWIWEADLQSIAEELKKIEKDFYVAKLRAKPEKP